MSSSLYTSEKEKYYYSKLLIIPPYMDSDTLEEKIIEAIEVYFNGTKCYFLVYQNWVLNFIYSRLHEEMRQRRLFHDNKNIYINIDNRNLEDEFLSESFQIFNFQVICIDIEQYAFSHVFEINDGKIDLVTRLFLEKVGKTSNFNSQAYFLEHNNLSEDIMVGASAGTGKTFNIINRIMYVLYNNNFNEEFLRGKLLLVTFTNAAVEEMKSRLENILENYYKLTKDIKYMKCLNQVVNMNICTIHSWFIKMIRANSEALGIGNNFDLDVGEFEIKQILDYELNKRLTPEILYILRYNQITVGEFSKAIFNYYSVLLSKNVDFEKGLDIEVIESEHGDLKMMTFINEIVREVYAQHEKKLRLENKVSLKYIGVLLRKLIKLFEDVEFNYSYNFQHVFIDEFQDTDDNQIALIMRLKNIYGFKLYIVGDVKQSIYRFRGADLTAFEKVEIEKQGRLTKYKLIKNYRTTYALQNCLNNIFQKMSLDGLLPFEHPGIFKVDYTKESYKGVDLYKSGYGDITNKMAKSLQCYSSEQYKGKRIAVLARTNKQALGIIKECKAEGIDNIRSGDIGNLYNGHEAVELLKFANAVIFNKKPEYLLEFLASNYIKGQILPRDLFNKTDEAKLNLIENTINKVFLTKLNISWKEFCNSFRERCNGENFLKGIYNLKPWRGVNNPEEYKINLEKILDIYFSMNNIEYFDITKFKDDMSISIFTGKDEERVLIINKDKADIVCTTIHKVKGMEFDHVVFASNFLRDNSNTDVQVVNGNVNVFINIEDKKMLTSKGYDEKLAHREFIKDEGRLIYVALTRAKENFRYFINDKSFWEVYLRSGSNEC